MTNMASFALTTLFLLGVSVLSIYPEFTDDGRLKRSKRSREWQILDNKGKTFKDVPDWQDFTPKPGPSLNDVIFESSDNMYHGYPRYTASSGNILARSTTPATSLLSEYYSDEQYKSRLNDVEHLKLIQSHVNRLKLVSTPPSPPKVVPDVDPNILRLPPTSTVSGRRMLGYYEEQNQMIAKLMAAVMPRVEHHAPFELDDSPRYDGRAESLRAPWLPEGVQPRVLAPGSALEAFKQKYGPTTEFRRRTRRRKLTTTPPFATMPTEDEYVLDETEFIADKNLPNKNNYIPNITFKPKLPEFGIPENRRANIYEESQLTDIDADSRIKSKISTERDQQSVFKSKKNKMENVDPQLTDEDDFTPKISKIKTLEKIPQKFDISEPQFTDDLVADDDSTRTLSKNDTEGIIPLKYGISEYRRANTGQKVTDDEIFKLPPNFDKLRKGKERIDPNILAEVDFRKIKDLASYSSDEEFRNFLVGSKKIKNIADSVSSNNTKDPLDFFFPPTVTDKLTGKERLEKKNPQIKDVDDFTRAGSKFTKTDKTPLEFGMSENRRANTNPLVAEDEEFKSPPKIDILRKGEERIDPHFLSQTHKDLASDISDEEFGKFLTRAKKIKKITDFLSSNKTKEPLEFLLPPSVNDKFMKKERLEKNDGILKKLLEPENESIEAPVMEKNESDDYELEGVPIR